MALFHMDVPSNHILNVFGYNDLYVKKIERSFGVTVVNRDGINISGDEVGVRRASAVLNRLFEQSLKGNEIEESGVDYAIAMSMEEQVRNLDCMDDTIICHTIGGKPIKPKTLGQKEYVDAIKNNMITFGLGPAGTGKTYLAMAMAITAF